MRAYLDTSSLERSANNTNITIPRNSVLESRLKDQYTFMV
jgi:hypothetical protein